MYVSPISALFPGGKSTPAKRAIYLLLSLSLFVFRVDANDAHHTFAVDHLAFVANLLYRRSYLHKTPRRALACPPDSFRVILPRVGSCGDTSTSTLSPETNRTKFLFTAPTRWAKTFCCPSNTTR